MIVREPECHMVWTAIFAKINHWGDIGGLTMLTEDCGHSRMIMPVIPQYMILTDNSYKGLDQIEDNLKTEEGIM